MEYQSLLTDFENNISLIVRLMLDNLHKKNKEIFAYNINLLDDLSDVFLC